MGTKMPETAAANSSKATNRIIFTQLEKWKENGNIIVRYNLKSVRENEKTHTHTRNVCIIYIINVTLSHAHIFHIVSSCMKRSTYLIDIFFSCRSLILLLVSWQVVCCCCCYMMCVWFFCARSLALFCVSFSFIIKLSKKNKTHL